MKRTSVAKPNTMFAKQLTSLILALLLSFLSLKEGRVEVAGKFYFPCLTLNLCRLHKSYITSLIQLLQQPDSFLCVFANILKNVDFSDFIHLPMYDLVMSLVKVNIFMDFFPLSNSFSPTLFPDSFFVCFFQCFEKSHFLRF